MIVDLLSPLSRTECEKRLHRHVSSEWSLTSDSGVVGRIDGDSFRIRKRILYRHSFQKYLTGQLSDAGSGARIHCEVREMDLKWVFVAAGGVAALAFFGALIAMFAHRADLDRVPMVALIAMALLVPVLVAIMVGAVALGRHLSRNESQFLVDFLKRTLEAR